MKKPNRQELLLKRLFALLMTCLVAVSFLSACEKPTLGVNLHGVNYTKDTFSFVVSDPARPDSASGGELIDPFAGGGMTCCVTLPKKWHPGIKLYIQTTHWVETGPNRDIEEIKNKQVVDVPKYEDGKPGELWVLREADGKVSVVSSNFQPDHPKWPGRVKGWPVPSLEYRHERWELHRKQEQRFVNAYLKLIAELEKSPDVQLEKAWEHAKLYEPESLKGFLGPKDPRYLKYLKEDYQAGLNRSREDLRRIMEMKP